MPVNAFEMPSALTAGSIAATNQSETSAAADACDGRGRPTATPNGRAPWLGSSSAASTAVGAEVRPEPDDVDDEQADGADDRDRDLVAGSPGRRRCPRGRAARSRTARAGAASPCRWAAACENASRSSGAARAPATIASPSTSSALAKSEPRIDVCATTISPAESEKSTMNSSGRLPSVDCSTPVTAGPNRAPTDSVATPMIQARPPSAAPQTMKTAVGEASCVVQHAAGRVDRGDGGRREGDHAGHDKRTKPIAGTSPRASAPTPRAPSRLRRRGAATARPGRCGARGTAPGPARRSATTASPTSALNSPVSRVAVALLDRAGALAGDRRQDVDQVGDAGLVVAAPHLAAGVGDRRPELLADQVGLVEQRTVPCGVPPVVDIFLAGSWRSMIRAPTSG